MNEWSNYSFFLGLVLGLACMGLFWATDRLDAPKKKK